MQVAMAQLRGSQEMAILNAGSFCVCPWIYASRLINVHLGLLTFQGQAFINTQFRLIT